MHTLSKMTAVITLAASCMAAVPAEAGSIAITYRSGGGHHGYSNHHGKHYNHYNKHHGKGWGHGHYKHHYWSPPVWNHVYYAPRPVIFTHYSFVQPIYVQPQQVAFGPELAGNDGYCREYQSKVRIGGLSQSGYGTACLQPDGSWQIVD